MTIAQDMARARYDEIQAKLSDPGTPLEEQVRLKIELFPMVVIMTTTFDLSWWKPEKMCPLPRLSDWVEDQTHREEHPECYESDADWP